MVRSQSLIFSSVNLKSFYRLQNKITKYKMAIIKFKDIEKLSQNEREERIKELRIELIKNKVAAKAKTNIREIKRAIARVLTFNRLNNKAVEK